jgi:hypothetical protein
MEIFIKKFHNKLIIFHRAQSYKTFLIFLFFTSCLFQNIPCWADVATGLVGWWKMNQSSGATVLDSSGNANLITFNTAPTWVAGQIGNYAASLNGTNQYGNTTTVTNIPTVQGAQTLSAWVYINAIASEDIVDNIDGTTSANQLRVNTAGEAEVSKWSGGITITETSKVLAIHTWYMVTFTWDGTTNIIYVNGVATTPTSATAHQNVASTTVFIGAYGTGAGNENFNGYIDDVRIYNRALSAADVAQLYDYYTGRNGLFTLLDR